MMKHSKSSFAVRVGVRCRLLASQLHHGANHVQLPLPRVFGAQFRVIAFKRSMAVAAELAFGTLGLGVHLTALIYEFAHEYNEGDHGKLLQREHALLSLVISGTKGESTLPHPRQLCHLMETGRHRGW